MIDHPRQLTLMKSIRIASLLLVAAFGAACHTPPDGPPKTVQEMNAESRAGKVPDTVRDPRPEMPGTGPIFMPMR